MELSAAHLRYLLAIYETAATQRDICSRTIAERLGVTRPSVARALDQLMDRGMIVKAHYGKVYLTDRGVFVARRGQQQGARGVGASPPVGAGAAPAGPGLSRMGGPGAPPGGPGARRRHACLRRPFPLQLPQPLTLAGEGRLELVVGFF